MQTKEQIEQAFRADLQALLNKYNASLETADHWQGYAECGENVRMTVYIPSSYGPDGECLGEYIEIDLGHLQCPTKKT